MVQVSGSNKNNTVGVQQIIQNASVEATNNQAKYYSNISKEWATGVGLIQNIDYSSKHYAQLSKDNALISATNLEELRAMADNVVTDIINTKDNINQELYTIAQELNSDMVNSANQQKEEFENDIQEIVIDNIAEIQSYETASKGYAEDAKESAQLALSAAGIHYDVLTSEDVNVSVLGKDYVSYTEFTDAIKDLQPKGDYTTQEDVFKIIATIPQFKIHVSQMLPPTGDSMTLYLTPKEGTDGDVYNEYVWIEQTATFEFLGTTAVDLTDYVKNTDYASGSKGGTVKMSTYYGTEMQADGKMHGIALSLDQYKSSDRWFFIAKGTLDNVLTQYPKAVVTTEANYNSLETKDPNTLYLIED